MKLKPTSPAICLIISDWVLSTVRLMTVSVRPGRPNGEPCQDLRPSGCDRPLPSEQVPKAAFGRRSISQSARRTDGAGRADVTSRDALVLSFASAWVR